MTIDYIPGTTSNLVGDPAEGGAFSSGNKGEIAGANTSAANAATSATAAAASATAAAQSATNLSASESNAATSATNAAASATSATASQAATSGYLGSVTTIYDNFDDRYLGAKTTEPTLDNDGGALLVGAMYFNSTTNLMKVYNGSAWQLTAVDNTTILLKAQNLADLPSVSTARTNLGLGTMALETAADYAELSGATFTGNVTTSTGLTVGDATSSLQLTHDGNNSYIKHVHSAGTLRVPTRSFAVRNAADNKTLIRAAEGAEAELYHDGQKKIETTDTGVYVTGNAVASTKLGVGLKDYGDGNGAVPLVPTKPLHIYHAENDVVARIESGDTGAGFSLIDSTTSAVIRADNGVLKLMADFANEAAGSHIELYVDGSQVAEVTPTGLNVTGTINATTAVDTPSIEVTNLKARDGSAAGSIADSTGVVTLASSVLTTADINGGTADNVVIGGSTAAAGTFTTGTIATADINGGAIDGTVIGGSTAAAGTFTTVDSTGTVTATRADNGINFHAISTDDDVNNGPLVTLERIVSTAEAGDNLGQLNFVGRNDASTPESITYGQIFTEIKDPTNSTEGGLLELRTVQGGFMKAGLTLFDNNGQAEVTVNGNKHDMDFRVKGSGDGNEALFMVDAANTKVGIKTETPTADLHVNGLALVEGEGSATTDPTLIVDRTGTVDGAILSLKAGGTTNATFFSTGGNRVILCDNTNTGIKFTPSSIHPRTSTNAVLNNTIDLGLSSSKFRNVYADGIIFDDVAGNASSNTLDDYEEGTWTPAYTAVTTSPTVTYAPQNGGHYTKVGRLVTLTGRIRTASVDNSPGGTDAEGDLRISGLPFAVSSDVSELQNGTLHCGQIKTFTSGRYPAGGYAVRGTSEIGLTRRGSSSGNMVNLDVYNSAGSEFTLETGNNSNEIVFSVVYYTDE